MGLGVETPDPPGLTNRGFPRDVDPDDVSDGLGDLRRQELEDVLRDGAWTEAFREWAEYTDLNESEYRTVRDHGLFERLDFYWDPAGERLRFEQPELPEELTEQRELGSLVAAELSDLGDTVLETLADGYVDWSGGPMESDEWRGESFDEEASGDRED